MVLFEHHLWSSGFQVIEIAKRFQVLVMVPEHLTRIQQNWGLRGPLEEKKNNHLVLHTTSAGLLRDCPPNITCITAVILLSVANI